MPTEFLRKSNRMPTYDYSSNGMYFITICTQGKSCLLADSSSLEITAIGRFVQGALNQIEECYPGARIDKYVIMPNHVHILLELFRCNTSISTIMGQFKRAVSLQAGQQIWQKSFYDHVIRNESDYQRIWEYIESNPKKWHEDMYYSGQ